MSAERDAYVAARDVNVNSYGGEAVPFAVAAKEPSGIFAAVDLKAFTGREWLAAEIDRFVASCECGYMFIEAEAGLGKTALAAWLVRSRGYVSHFSRYPGGRQQRAALRNLSAQLIRDCLLTDLAPGGMVPEWAQDPGGFEMLLAAAAAAHDGPLVLVIDGLDEALAASPNGASQDGLPFGLPLLLPSGVFVIATYRTGFLPPWPECPAATFAIRRDDLRNQRDVEAYLSRAVAEDVLAARLAEAGEDPAGFAARLARRCGGVWVYLRYVLAELRLGMRHPSEIDALPSGLFGYYADQLGRWQQDPAWASELLPLLAVLAVAGEPLAPATLARLAGAGTGVIDQAVVRRRCDVTFRPVLNPVAVGVGGPRRYELYHASLREVLAGEHGQATERGNWPDRLIAQSAELAEAARAAHHRNGRR